MSDFHLLLKDYVPHVVEKMVVPPPGRYSLGDHVSIKGETHHVPEKLPEATRWEQVTASWNLPDVQLPLCRDELVVTSLNPCTSCYEGMGLVPLWCWSEGVARTGALGMVK